jgi:hypothetical protein
MVKLLKQAAVLFVVAAAAVQVSTAQAPNRPAGASVPTQAQESQLDAAEAIADRISQRVGGSVRRDFAEWRTARKANRVVMLPPTTPRRKVRAWTWPDVPRGAGGGGGEYKPGQTAMQFVGIAADQLECPCVAAILILHEGRRCGQEHLNW